MISNDQLDLIEAFLDDALPEDALRRVRELVGASPEFARELQQAMQLRGQCAVSRGADAEAFVDGVMLRLAAPEPAEAAAPRLTLRMRPLPPSPAPLPLRFPQPPARVEPRPRHGWTWGQWAAAAALFVVLAGLAAFFVWDSGNLGTVGERDGEVVLMRGGRELALVPGATVRAGDQIRAGKDGTAVVAYRDGTTLKALPESELGLGSFHGAKRIRLVAGAVHMDVAKQPDGRPLEIATEHSRCTVRGTKFDVLAAEGYTRLDVQEGRVEMRAASQPEQPLMVAAGQHAATDGTAAPAPIVFPATDGVLEMKAADAVIRGKTARLDGDHVGCWTNAADSVEWACAIAGPGDYRVLIEYACDKVSAGSAFEVSAVEHDR
jgi:ferric-dicitrate binding protein FerR (iron transport regulator)